MADDIQLYKSNAYAVEGESESILLFKSNAYLVGAPNPYIRLYYSIAQEAVDTESHLRLGFMAEEQALTATSHLRLTYIFIQDIIDTASKLRAANVITQVIIPVLPEPPMSELPLPGFGNDPDNNAIPAAANPAKTSLPGLTFEVHKTPNFKTNIKEAPSGNEVRNALMEFPRWDFELEYEYLRDQAQGTSSLQTLMGFFLQMRGSYDTFLFKDPDDYLVVNNSLGVGTGVLTSFGFMRSMGGFNELVGQVDTTNTIALYYTLTQSEVVPATPGPYTITVDNFPIVEDLGVMLGMTPLVKVTGAPATGQYAVVLATGVYTFNAAQEGDAVDITYRYEVDDADYTIVLPNHVQFDTAPAEDVIVTASFQFFFACRFLEDSLDFAKFMDKLWNLNQCNFRSVIQ